MTDLPDITEVVPEGSITLPIRGVKYRFKPFSAALGYILDRAMSRGGPGLDLLPDDRTAAEYRDLFGENFNALGPLDGEAKLSFPEFEHLVATLVSWNLYGRESAERVWTRSPKHREPADTSSAGAPARTASTSGTSGPTAPKSGPKRKRRR